MTVLPIDPAANANPGALRAFLGRCAEEAPGGRPRLVSISVQVGALDPLAVLESIFEPGEPHFYAERPDLGMALAGAETAVARESHGPDRFEATQRWIEGVLADAVAVGEVDGPFGGPHFFCSFTFADETEPGEVFPAAWAFVPRWQVARAGSRTLAVANLQVGPGSDLDALTARVWRAHAKFRNFDYRDQGVAGERAAPVRGGTLRPVPTQPPAAAAAPPADAFRGAVTQALAGIKAGEFEKIVLARAIDLAADAALHPLELLNGLRQRFPNCYAFSLANGRGQSFIGASPERLVRVSGGLLETEAMAGSMRRGGSASEDAALGAALMRSEKDRWEQRLVLEAIVGGLRELGLEPKHAAEPELRKLANVQHLCTPVRAELRGPAGLLQAVAALHPTPAVGGWPSRAAVARIRELEGFPRGLYSGALGWIDARGGGEFFVGLRSALLDGAATRLYAGAGIVAGSNPEREGEETDLKFRALLDALGDSGGSPAP